MALARKKTKAMVWQPLSELDAAPIDARLRGLIGVAGSLTHTLREQCAGGFRLRLLGERPAPENSARVREVIMLCGDTPWVFAQTVIPETTLATNPWLAQLGDQPLGDRLFEREGVQRHELRFGRLPAGDELLERAQSCAGLEAHSGALWARRSTIALGVHELFVNEVFLPHAGQRQAR